MRKKIFKIAIALILMLGVTESSQAQPCGPCGPCWNVTFTPRTTLPPNTSWSWEYCFNPSCGSRQAYVFPQGPCMQCPGTYCECPCRIVLNHNQQPLQGNPIGIFANGSASSSGIVNVNGICYQYSYTVVGNNLIIDWIVSSLPC